MMKCNRRLFGGTIIHRPHFSLRGDVTEYADAQGLVHSLMAGIQEMTVPNLARQMESTMNDIKLEAEKDCSLQDIEYLIKIHETEGRRLTILRKACMVVNGGWWKGRLYHAHEGNLIMTPTNMSSISWLDLADYSLDFKKMFPSCQHFHTVAGTISEPFRYEYDLEKRQHDFTKEYEYFTKKYFHHVERCMKLEKTFTTAALLTRMWDSVKFIRYINSAEGIFRFNLEFHLRIFPRLLIEHCNDSKIIVNYFIIMTYFTPCINSNAITSIVRNMKLPYLHFFMIHIMNILRIHPQRSLFEHWITQDLQLVERAFLLGQYEKLEFVLGFGWPHECFSNEVGYLLLCEFDSPSFSHIETTSCLFCLIDLSSRSKAPSTILTQGIQLFWRCLKTPYVSLDDLVHLGKLTNHRGNPIDIEFHAGVSRRSVASLLSFYPADCLATYQPRSLLHLSRCKIRETIYMMDSVNVLPLPSNLKDYLWLKW